MECLNKNFSPEKLCHTSFVLTLTLSGTREVGKTASLYTDTFYFLHIDTFSGNQGTSITQTMLQKPSSKPPGAMDRSLFKSILLLMPLAKDLFVSY